MVHMAADSNNVGNGYIQHMSPIQPFTNSALPFKQLSPFEPWFNIAPN